MPTLSQEATHRTAPPRAGAVSSNDAVALSRSQLLELIGRARELKTRMPSFVLPPLVTGTPSSADDVVVDLPQPIDVLADLLTMTEKTGLPLNRIAFCCVGDGSSNLAGSLLLVGTALGMDVRLATPLKFWPSDLLIARGNELAATHQGHLTVTTSTSRGADGANFVVAVPYPGRGTATRLTEYGSSAAAADSLARERALNRLWVMDAVLADWLKGSPDGA